MKRHGVIIVGCHQVLVGARFHNAPLIQGNDLIGIADGGQSMGDNDDGLLPCHAADGVDNIPAGFQVNLADGVVQNQNIGCVQQATSDGNALFLAT